MGSLAFANPLLLWGALAVALPIAIHLLSRRRARRMAFAALDFVMRAKRRKVTSIRLRQLLLLLLRMAIVACVAFAIARPLLKKQEAVAAAASTRTAAAIVLDASLSMRYRLGGKTLFEHAVDEGRTLVESLPAESAATVVICDGRTPEVEPPGFDRIALKRMLSDARPTYLPADMTACMAAAARALGESPLEGKKIYVLGDLTGASIRLDAPPPRVPTPGGEVAPEIVFVDAAQGKALPNVAVTELTVQPSAALGTRGFEVAATVRNSGDEPARNVPIALRVDGTVVTRGFVDVPARGSARKVLAHRFESGTRRCEVALESEGLVEDDSRSFVLRVPRDVRALVVDGDPAAVRHRDEAFFVEAALGPGRTGGRISATFLDADAAQSRPLEGFDVVLLLNVLPPRADWIEQLRTFVEGGGGLFIALGDHVEPDAYNAAFGRLLPRPLHLVRTAAEPDDDAGPPPARFARVDLRHPAFAIFEGASEGFDSARIYRYVLPRPDAGDDERILATLDDGAPVLLEAKRGRGRVLLYGSTVDRDWTDWPIRTSFLPAIQQLTAYLAGGLDEAPPQPTRVGETRTFEPGANATVESVKGPDGKAVKVEENAVKVEVPGQWTVEVHDAGGSRDAPELAFAAVLDPRESDTSRLSPEELATTFGGPGAASVAGDASSALPKSGTPLWTWLLVAAVGAFLLEGVLVRRA